MHRSPLPPAFRGLVRLALVIGLAGLAACGSGSRPDVSPAVPPAVPSAACAGLPALNPAAGQLIDPQAIDQWMFDAAVRHAANAERCRRGLPPLAGDPVLVRAASLHSGDMVRHGFFDHASPVSGRGTLRDRVSPGGAQYIRVAENIAEISLYDFAEKHFNRRDPAACDFTFTPGGPSIPRQSYAGAARRLIGNWMESAGHRRNLLHPGMTRHGAGVAFRPDPAICGTLVVVQDFAG
jgi:uncharacterized protein YkwD